MRRPQDKLKPQCKDIPELPILRFLRDLDGVWATWWDNGYSMPTVASVMPSSTPDKVKLAKMNGLMERGLVDGCGCGCRGDFVLTPKGEDYLRSIEPQEHVEW